MAPGIALEVLRDPQKPLRILDPMMGSGTVIAVARSNGHRAVGIDTDPLAVLVSKVWSTSINPEEMQERAVDVLNRARLIFPSLSTRNSYPPHADKETRRFIS